MRAPAALVLAALAWALVAGQGEARGGQASACGAALTPAAAARACLPAPVASFEPARTDALWRSLVKGRRLQVSTVDCRPARVVFYAATDWMRLATTVAAGGSPCGDYHVSVPPLASDKTVFRVGQAERLRALGPNVHALAEINYTGWAAWVTSQGKTWFDAGVEARARMAAAGYDVTRGDTWAVNELSSAVRTNSGAARANARELIRGLATGNGVDPPVKGVVFAVGIGQGASDLLAYQARLESWLQDSAFWADMALYVSDWSDEVYGDIRSWAAPATVAADRRNALNDYLQHRLVLARSGPLSVATAKAFLESASTPLANAAWQWPSAFGWTDVPVEIMKGYVSSQVHALRAFSAAQPSDRFGFAWAPRNGAALAAADFNRQTADLLSRLATAIRDSGTPSDPFDPGGGACGPPGQNLYCIGDVEGARLNPSWQSFRAWELPLVAFISAPQTVAAGAASAPLTAELRQGLVQRPAPANLTLTLTSSSPTGAFAPAADGPWTPALALPIAAGATGAPPFFFRDTKARAVTITAAVPGNAAGTQVITVLPAEAATVAIAPAEISAIAGSTVALTATAVDAFGNVAVATGITWSVLPGAFGTVVPTAGSTATLTTIAAGTGMVRAMLSTSAGQVVASATVKVAPPPLLHVTGVRTTPAGGAVRVRVTVTDALARKLARGRVTVAVLRNGKQHKRASAQIKAGVALMTVTPAKTGCFVVRLTAVNAAGLRWSGRTPTNRLCRRVA